MPRASRDQAVGAGGEVAHAAQRRAADRRRIEDRHVGRAARPRAARGPRGRTDPRLRAVSRRTASSSESTPFSRTQWPSSSVGAQASQSWLACAPASESPSMVAGCASSSATMALVGVQDRDAEARLEIRSRARGRASGRPDARRARPRRRRGGARRARAPTATRDLTMSAKRPASTPLSLRSRNGARNSGSA